MRRFGGQIGNCTIECQAHDEEPAECQHVDNVRNVDRYNDRYMFVHIMYWKVNSIEVIACKTT